MAALTTTHDDPIEHSIDNDAFWGGDVEAGDFQEVYRVPASIAPETFIRQLELAIAEINGELATWRAAAEAEGLEALTAEQRKFYLEACYAWAYALLTPMLTTLYMTDQGDGLDNDMEGNEARYRSRAQGFLNRITGVPLPGEVSIAVF